MPLQHWFDKTQPPDAAVLCAALGAQLYAYWTALDTWLRDTYAVEPLAQFGSQKTGWTFRYRKGGRPLCEMTPAQDGFQVLVVLGAKEAQRALAGADELGPAVRGCLESASVYHDGRWLFMHVQSARDVEDIQRLVTFKRPVPKKKAAA